MSSSDEPTSYLTTLVVRILANHGIKQEKKNMKYWIVCLLLGLPSVLFAQTTDAPGSTDAANTVQSQQKIPVPAITHENVSYGDHPNQVIDFWKAAYPVRHRWSSSYTEVVFPVARMTRFRAS